MKSLLNQRPTPSDRKNRVFRRSVIPIIILALSIGLMLATGLLGVGRQGGFAASNADVVYFYMSAKAWLSGLNPYDYEIFRKFAQTIGRNDVVPFAYPPHSFVLGGLLSLFPYSVAKGIMAALNLFCVVAIAFLGVHLLRMREDAAGVARSHNAWWVIPAIVFGNPFTSHVLWTGQTAFIVGVAVILGWLLLNQGFWLVGGILIGLATFKPQLTVLIVLWLLLERRWQALLVAGGTALLCAIVPMLATSPVDTFSTWLQAMADYKGTPGMAPGTGYIIGISSVLKALGIETSKQLTVALTIFGAFPLTIYLFRLRKRTTHGDVLALLLALPILFIYAHDYDLAILVPVVSAFYWHLRSRFPLQIVALGLMILLFTPYRLIARFEPPTLVLHWRTFILGLLITWLFIWVVRNKNQTADLNNPSSRLAEISLR